MLSIRDFVLSARAALPVGLALLAAAAPLAAQDSGRSASASGSAGPADEGPSVTAYPETKTLEHTDTYHGVEVADPYRWLENDVREDGDVADWVGRQNDVTFRYLESIPERQTIVDRLTALWDYEKVSAPFEAGGRSYVFKNDGLQNHSVLFTADSWEALAEEGRPVLDPNQWSDDGTVALGGQSFSDDGRYMAYARQESGSDWRTWHVRDLTTGDDLPDALHHVKFSGAAWTADGEGFFYGRFPAPAAGEAFLSSSRDHKLYYHRVGTPQAEDELVYERPDQPDWSFGATVSDDGRWLVISVWRAGPPNLVYLRDLRQRYAAPRELIGGWDGSYNFVGSQGDELFFLTDRDAPRGRIVAVDARRPEREHWRTVVPEGSDTLRSADIVGGRLLCSELHDATTRVRVLDLDGHFERAVDLPGLGRASGFSGHADDREVFYSFESYATPPSTYHYDLESGVSRLIGRATVDVDPDDYVVRQVFYASKDGTRIPLFLCHRADTALDGEAPTLLYGYGGFNISILPSFSVSKVAWMDLGGVYAVANLRGGGEYGEEWHAAGTKLNKQNVFDDFIAAAEWLIAQGYTSSGKLAISGRSNGGLLVGAAMTQRPELFGAALPAVGVMDMLRFQHFTAGKYWTHDYGSSDDPAQFAALKAYSPYHNLRAGTSYPATMVTTADTDDRVVPGHSFKFAAALQAAHGGTTPVLIRIETGAGHGAGKPTAMKIAEVADEWAFLVENLDMDIEDVRP